MHHRVCILVVLAAVLLPASTTNDELLDDDLDRERRLLDTLLGGGGGRGGGGLLGGVLGSNGLLGSLLGGGASGGLPSAGGDALGGQPGGGGGGGLLGGLLGGGGAGGLLGGLLGGGGNPGLLGSVLGGGAGGGSGGLLGGLLGGGGNNGLLGGLLGGNSSLLGGLLSGQGLLGGLLGQKGLLSGLLGGEQLQKLLNAVFCLIEQLGLGLVLQLLNLLGVDTLLGLNEIVCQPEGQELLGFLVTSDGRLVSQSIIDEVLCLVKTLGLQEVLRLLKASGLDKVLGLRNITCANGVPLFPPGSSTAALLGQLLQVLDLDTVASVGVNEIIKLDRLLSAERITDIRSVLQQLSCLLKNIKLRGFINALEVVGIKGLVRLNGTICGNETSLIYLQAADKAGVKTAVILPALLTALGIDPFIKLANDIGLGELLVLGNFLVINGTLQANIAKQVFCVATSLGIVTLNRLLQTVGLQDVLALYSIVCPNGVAQYLPPNVRSIFLVDFISKCKAGSQITQCLQAVAKSMNENGVIVCYFCSRIGVNSVQTECNNVCRPYVG